MEQNHLLWFHFTVADHKCQRWMVRGLLQCPLDISQRFARQNRLLWHNTLIWLSISGNVSACNCVYNRSKLDNFFSFFFFHKKICFTFCCIVLAWNSVSRELDMCHNQPHSNASNYRNGASVTYYQEREPNPQMKGRQSRRKYRSGRREWNSWTLYF